MKQVPQRAIQFLRWFCREDYVEEIEGDLLELIEKKQYLSRSFARIRCWWLVLQYFRPAFLKSFRMTNPFNFPLFSLHAKVGWRNIRKSSLFSVINILGLALAILCSIGIALYVYDEYQYDRFHRNYKHIYRVVESQRQSGTQYKVASTPGPLGQTMKADFTEVRATCRFGRTMGSIRYQDQLIEPGDIRYTDNTVFSMFDFKLLKGELSTVLTKPDEIVLTESVAKQLFGEDWMNKADLLGSIVKLTAWGQASDVTITGIAADPPGQSHIQFAVLLPMVSIEKSDYFNWNSNSYFTYIQLDPAVHVPGFNQRLRSYIDKYSAYGSKDDARVLHLQPMESIYLHSDFDFGTNDAKSGNISYIRIYLTVGIMVLLIAIFNFVNLTTARVTHRSKEVGVRKVIGAKKLQLVMQFLTEAWMLTSMAVIVALALALLLLPFLNAITGKQLVLPLRTAGFWMLIAGFTILIGWLAGIYPAFFLSRGAASLVIKSGSSTGTAAYFRKLLVISQFCFSVMLLIASVIIYRQLNFVQNKELGFNREQLLYVSLKNELRAKAATFKNEVKKIPGIADAALSSHNLIDANNSTGSLWWEGQEPGTEFLMTHMNIDADLIPSLGITLKAGRNFYNNGVDTAAYIINETAVKKMGWTTKSAIGKQFSLWDQKGTIVGVVQDFHFKPLTEAIEPFLFRSWPTEKFSGLLVKIKPGQTKEALSGMEDLYSTMEQESVLQFQFLDQALEAQYRLHYTTGKIVLFFTMLAVLVSCLGLFGLATYAAEQRVKEIGIRKVLGASVSSIVKLLSRDLVKLVAIAVLIAIPIAYWSMHNWLQNFAFRSSLDWWVFALTGLITILIAIATISIQSIKAAVTNPATSLKSV
jgi:predicted permease